jgi:hypothetical protein
MRSGPLTTGAGAAAATGAITGAARFGTKSTGAAASVGAIAIPLAPPLDSGDTPSACHCCCSTAEGSAERGKLAHATVLHSSASTPALFQPGVGQARASDRRIGCEWARDVITGAVMPNQG